MKRGSLEIGVSFTVVMIIAMVILGLALVFVLNVFQFADEKFPKDAPNLIFHATAQDPIIPEENNIKIKPGEEETLAISVYNDKWSDEEEIALTSTECKDSQGNTESEIWLTSISQTIENGKDEGYLTILKAGENVPRGSYVCSVVAGQSDANGDINLNYPYLSKQISVEII